MNEQPSKQTIWASVGGTFPTKVQYQNIKIDVGVAGIPIDLSDEEFKVRMERTIETISKAVEILAVELHNKVSEMIS